MRNRIFLDTNILADLFLDRWPYSDHTLLLLNTAKDKGWKLSCSALTVANLLYLMRKLDDSMKQKALRVIQRYIVILDLKAEHLIGAMSFYSNDVEDAIQMQVAIENNQDYIITRDLKGFLNSPIEAKTLVEFLGFESE